MHDKEKLHHGEKAGIAKKVLQKRFFFFDDTVHTHFSDAICIVEMAKVRYILIETG